MWLKSSFVVVKFLTTIKIDLSILCIIKYNVLLKVGIQKTCVAIATNYMKWVDDSSNLHILMYVFFSIHGNLSISFLFILLNIYC